MARPTLYVKNHDELVKQLRKATKGVERGRKLSRLLKQDASEIRAEYGLPYPLIDAIDALSKKAGTKFIRQAATTLSEGQRIEPQQANSVLGKVRNGKLTPKEFLGWLEAA